MPLPNLTIRFAQSTDYEQLSSFYTDESAITTLKEILDQSAFIKIVVATIDNVIAGKCLLYILPWTAQKNKKKRAIISEVFVKEEYRRKGIAKEIILFCINETTDIVEDIQIDRVAPENEAAIQLYNQLFPKKKIVYCYP